MSPRKGWLMVGISALLLLVLAGVLTGWAMYDLPSAPILAISSLIAALVGGLLPEGINSLRNPELMIGKPFVAKEENHSMPKDVAFVRLPVGVKHETVSNVYAKVINVQLDGESDFNENTLTNGEFDLRGENTLFWAGHFKNHDDDVHVNIENPKGVLNHMGEWHLSAADPIDSIDVNKGREYVNVAMKVEGLPETFLADAIGSAPGKYPDLNSFCSRYEPDEDDETEFGCGQFRCKIAIGGENVKSKVAEVVYRTGPNFTDLRIPE